MTLKSNKSKSFKKINFKEKFSKFSEHWQPKVVANLNDYEIKLVKLKDDFVWHHHEETDEAFICLLYTSPSPRDGRISRMPSSA